jgi:DNA-binding IclR family transcriptional regulator
MKLLGQANKGLSQIEINDIAHPELEKLTIATGLASALFTREGNLVVCLAKVEGTGHVRTAAHVGKQMPMHATCTGKAILAYLPDEELGKIVGSSDLRQLTENTITSISLLKKELARVRSQGYAVDNQEYGIGVRGISAPVFDNKGRVVAAISASGATFELDRKKVTVISAVKAASLEVSKTLGYSESIVNNVYPHLADSNMERSSTGLESMEGV